MRVTELSKAAKKDSDMQIFLLNRMRLKLQTTEKQLEEEARKFKDLSSKLANVKHAWECNKLWITSLNEQTKLTGAG
jgi:dsDNA-specific endonuclease/ATPase MutS2